MAHDEDADRPRKQPQQARSRATVDAILEGAARVFRREGWSATTNRIAEEAGVAIGSLYEYFPNKQALLIALAHEHVGLAERELDAALAANVDTLALLTAIQAAIVASQRFPSHAVTLVENEAKVGSALRARVDQLRARVLQALAAHATTHGLDRATQRALATFQVIGELSARTTFEHTSDQEALLHCYPQMGCACMART